jgi:hypothetical protein
MKTIIALASVLSLLGLSACGSEEASTGSPGSPALDQCPRKGLGQLQTQHADAQARLVPGRPVSALVCRYRESSKIVEGKSSFPTQVSEQTISAGNDLDAFTAAFHSIPPARPGAFACESGIPLHYLVAFRYRHAPQVYVRVNYEGCGYVFNDPRHNVFQATPGLRAKLNALLDAQPKGA